ncbi:hypothetical protein VW35_17140 [Devosia soli]|uniref:GDP-L-fucose synthase n=1 Tax=Devosia soli TaxID=361041 RepID=A0A0F5L4H3_9HYPH|nr:GDP-L-fucose synthase [Devosia soli]KKB76517.1 hypothetical protein VW35_17140 [Devosia soli]
MHFDLQGKTIWIAGHGGMVGSALVRRLAREDCHTLTVDRATLDLRRQSEVEAFLRASRPDAIVLAAAKVGGILANQRQPVDFLLDNLQIETNVMAAAHEAGVDRLLFLGSSCIYPRLAPQPIGEEALLSGPLEPTNQWYALAKIAGLKLAEAYRAQYGRDYISAMPTNLYGPGDNLDPYSSHVVPALMKKAHEARLCGKQSMILWGTGSPRREFLHVDDCADALVHILQHYSDAEHINVGSGNDLTILALAEMICDVVGFLGSIEHDLSKPDGTPQKLMGANKISALGWRPAIPLREGLAQTYAWFTAQQELA